MVEHKGVVNRLVWMQDEYQIGPGDSILQKTPFSFDVSVWEFLWTLITGARLVVALPDAHKDTEYLTSTIVKNDITVLHFVPSMLGLFIEGQTSCPSLQPRKIFCSGEVASSSW